MNLSSAIGSGQRPGAASTRALVHGVLWLDKPVGLSSTQAMAKARNALQGMKAGHGGTLDPFATGLLPVLFGEATRCAQDLLDADKTYEATLLLGVRTTTGDPEGERLEASAQARASLQSLSPAQVQSVLLRFLGPQVQVPPMYSALKRDGVPLYELARRGETVERAARPIRIDSIEVLAMQLPVVVLAVRCSKGTYVRTLAEDIGQALGCGAHLTALRRTAIGHTTIAAARTLEALQGLPLDERRACLAPLDSLLQSLPAVTLDAGEAARFMHGQRLAGVPAAAGVPGKVRVYSSGRLIGLATRRAPGQLAPDRVFELTEKTER